MLKFMFSKKATKSDKVVSSKCQIDVEDFVNFCGLLRKHKLYVCIRSLKFPKSSDFLERKVHSKFIWLNIHVGIILALLRTNMDIVSFFFLVKAKRNFCKVHIF